eukprot:evm.model.scf_1807.1 EVM.evm.TU.scf_1807.1   scf_1807:280-13061(-)
MNLGSAGIGFISSFCDDSESSERFKNQLGRFTPCFIDTLVLGLAHIISIVLVSMHIHTIRTSRVSKYFQLGCSFFIQLLGIAASLICIVIPIVQFGARLAASAIPLSPEGPIGPYEWPGYVLPIISWVLVAVALILELKHFTWRGLWMVRFSICLVAAGQLAKFSFVLEEENHNLFFWVFVAYVAAQVALAAYSLLHFPMKSALELNMDDMEGYPSEYEALAGADEVASVSIGNVCPEYRASIFSLLTFSWMGSLARTGYKAPLTFDDMWSLPPYDLVDRNHARFKAAWATETKKKQPSLTRAMFDTAGYLVLAAIPLKLITDLAQFVSPVFINLLLDLNFSEPGATTRGYVYSGLVLVGLIIGTITDNQQFQRVMRAGFRLRAVLIAELHRKILYLTPSDRAKFSSGRIFNFVASDTETVQLVCQNLLGLMSSPVRILGAMAMLYAELGLASLVALASLILMVPAQAVVVKWSTTYMKRALSLTDERAKLEGELMSGIEVVKTSTWEMPFRGRIMDVRGKELAVLWKSFVLSACNTFLLTSIPAIVAVTTFGVYIALGNNLDASTAFTSLTLFGILRFPLFQLPLLVNQLINAGVSIKRMQEFLSSQEQPEMEATPAAPAGGTAISMHGDFSWDTSSPPCLTDINLDIPAGNLVAIVGSTGAGKSSLLSSMLGLTQQVSGGPLLMAGSVAFVPQSPFIVNASVRENILFGHEFNEQKYAEAVEAANLAPDFAAMPGGDLTELGERGVNVSGGQKQRIAIARAVYSGADTYLMDDPLSALDAKVGRVVFNKCIIGLHKGKTRVLVTNQLQYVSSADMVVFMSDGKVAEVGPYSELMAAGKGFARMMAEAQVEEEPEGSDAGKDKPHKPSSTPAQPTPSAAPTQAPPAPAAAAAHKEQKLTDVEKRSTGIVSRVVLWAYVKAMGGLAPFLVLMGLFISVEIFRTLATVWLSYWTEQGDNVDQEFYMEVYAALSLLQVGAALVNQLDLKHLSTIAADTLHQSLLDRLLRAPMAFFHTTPIGRIINRLTRDTSDIDKNLADFVAMFLRGFLQLITTIILIGIFTPLALPFLVPIMLLFYWLYVYFQTTVREIKRLDSINRSPVYGSISEALNGLATIRAFGAEKRLVARHGEFIDSMIVMSLANQSMNRWLSIRLESLGALAAFAAAVLTVEQKGSSGVAGLTLTYAFSITMLTTMSVRLASLAENMFNAVERVAEYTEIDQEAEYDIAGSVPDDWPDQGGVGFNNVQMRYRPGLPLILKGLTATIEPGQKVGVVGRTGAGKSSLINVLFRLVELSDGTIDLDGIDLSKIGLRQLRSRMAIIPQVPVMFTGTMRANLDPFNEYSDEEVWAALGRAHLDGVVGTNSKGLEMELQEGGAPLSAGQKQLVALARALLKRSKVLILDEATANVDVETDALIQRTIREEFADCTVIAIAHRLHTIIDGDRVLVLDAGQVAEFDSPKELLSRPDGILTGMVHETGEATERLLRAIAFGEVKMVDIAAEEAAKALTRVGSEKLETPRTLSADLVSYAQTAMEQLRHVHAKLSEKQEEQDQQRDLGVMVSWMISTAGTFA